MKKMDTGPKPTPGELRPGEEEALADLLRATGPAARPPEELTRRVRAAVVAEWLAVTRQQRQAAARRRILRPALAAILAAAAVGAWLALPLLQQPAAPVATLSRVIGPVESGQGDAWQPVVLRQRLRPGQELVTGPRGRAALTLDNGLSLRLDTDTRIALAAADRVSVERGAVYLDAGPGADRTDTLVIESRYGRTRHLGTRYEVRLAADGMRVSVREGRVEVSGAGRTAELTAGEAVALDGDGRLERSTVATTGPAWDWTAEVAPPYAIEQRPLPEFLAWVGRETGRQVIFATPAARSAAGGVVLRGSVAGLSPEAALAAVMATTPLDYAEDSARIVVKLR